MQKGPFALECVMLLLPSSFFFFFFLVTITIASYSENTNFRYVDINIIIINNHFSSYGHPVNCRIKFTCNSNSIDYTYCIQIFGNAAHHNYLHAVISLSHLSVCGPSWALDHLALDYLSLPYQMKGLGLACLDLLSAHAR